MAPLIRTHAFFYFILLFTPLSAKDKITLGFERMAVHDYFQARQSFFSAIKKQPVPAYYGLSIISSSNNNPFYNLDTSRIYILTADTFFRHLTIQEEAKLKDKYNIGPDQINAQKNEVAKLAYASAQSQNTIPSWNAFIETYFWSVLSDSATFYRNELAFSAAKRENSSNGYKDFFTKFPGAIQSLEARRRYEDRLFREQTADGTELSFAAFINNNSGSPYRMQAEDSLFAIATKQKTPDAFYSFAKKYPANKNAQAAWMKLYNRYLETNRPDNLTGFFERYPDFKYRNQVEEEFRLLNVELLPVRLNNDFTFITEEGNQPIPNLYDDIDEFSEGLCAVSRNGKYGYINKSGKLVIDFRFEEADPFESGFATVKFNGKANVINRDGETLLPQGYEEVSIPHDNRILFLDSTGYGYMDILAKPVIPPRFEVAHDYSSGLAVAGKEDEVGIIDINGQWVLPAKYNSVIVYENGLIRVELDEQFGLLNRLGDEVLIPEYDAIGKFSHGLALIAKEEKHGYIDANGKIAIPFLFDFDRQTMDRSEFRNGYAEVREKGKSTLIDTIGNKIIPAVYDDLHFYGIDMPVAARRKTKWGFISMENKTVIPFKYDQVNSFSEGLAVVRTGKFSGVIDSSGKTVIPFLYEFISPFRNATAICKTETGYGLVSRETVLVEPGYEKYQWVTKAVIRFDRSGKYGYYNSLKKEWIWREEGL